MVGNKRAPRRYLVAGGAGFVGSNLAGYFLGRGDIVDVVDNLSTGHYENVAAFEETPEFRYLPMDVADPHFCRFMWGSYDAVFHLACPTGVPNIAIMGEEMLATCSSGTLNLLRIAKRSDASFIYASSAEAYGDPQVFPQSEDYVGSVDPVGPRSPYEEGKRFGEALTRYWGRKYALKTSIVRIFNTYGPNMSLGDQRVIPQMIGSLIAGRPVVVFGDGEQNRTFLHVDDLVRALDLVARKGGSGEVYNIGGDRQISMNELFCLITEATGLFGTKHHRPHFIADHKGRLPDTAKIRALGWKPKVSLTEGLRSYFASLHRRPVIKAPSIDGTWAYDLTKDVHGDLPAE